MLDTFLQGVADPSEWEVVVWQAPADPALGDAAQHYLQAAKQWQGEVGQFVSFTQAAGELKCCNLGNNMRQDVLCFKLFVRSMTDRVTDR